MDPENLCLRKNSSGFRKYLFHPVQASRGAIRGRLFFIVETKPFSFRIEGQARGIPSEKKENSMKKEMRKKIGSRKVFWRL